MTDITRFPGGVSNRGLGEGIGAFFPFLDPTRYVIFFEDFFRYVANDWVVTTVEAGAGSATEAVTNGHGGLLLVTNDAADDDSDFFQYSGTGAGTVGAEFFRFATGRKAWFECRFQTSDATQSDIVFGLQITDTTPLAVTDGVYFLKSDGSTSVTFNVTKDSTSSSLSSVATLANATNIKLGFYYDGASTFKVYVNGLDAGTITGSTNLPDDEDLTISFGIQNGEAVAKTLTVDYIIAAMER